MVSDVGHSRLEADLSGNTLPDLGRASADAMRGCSQLASGGNFKSLTSLERKAIGRYCYLAELAPPRMYIQSR
jgi:hypothetical protein